MKMEEQEKKEITEKSLVDKIVEDPAKYIKVVVISGIIIAMAVAFLKTIIRMGMS